MEIYINPIYYLSVDCYGIGFGPYCYETIDGDHRNFHEIVYNGSKRFNEVLKNNYILTEVIKFIGYFREFNDHRICFYIDINNNNELSKDRIKKRTQIIYYELIEKTYVPNRILDWCISINDLS
jgi:hypothetical protein